jgi:hypothetical protein
MSSAPARAPALAALLLAAPAALAQTSPPPRVASIDPAVRSDADPNAARDVAQAKPDLVKGYQVESGVASSSVFRGRPLYTTRADPSSQTTLALTLALGPGALTVSAWNATALARFGDQPGTAIEVDLTAAYTVPLPASLEASFGYLAYLYPKPATGQHVDGAHEVFASLAHQNPIVTPKLSVYAEVARLRGVYASLAGSHTFELGPVSIVPQASLGFAAYHDVPAQLNDVTVSASFQWTFFAPGYLALRGAYSYLAGPSTAMPADLQSPLGRSVPWAMLAVGAQR